MTPIRIYNDISIYSIKCNVTTLAINFSSKSLVNKLFYCLCFIESRKRSNGVSSTVHQGLECFGCLIIDVCIDYLSVFSFYRNSRCHFVVHLEWACMAVLDCWSFDRVLCTWDVRAESFVHLMALDLTHYDRVMMNLDTLLDRRCQGSRSILVWNANLNNLIFRHLFWLSKKFDIYLGALLDCFLLGLGGDVLWFLSITVAFRSESMGFE